MKLKYLGTAASEGWPALFCHCEACERAKALGGKDIRTRAQAVVDDTLLIDLGPDTYLHQLHHGLNLPRVQAVLVTHSHSDHWAVSNLYYRGEPYAYGMHPLPVWGNPHIGEDIARLRPDMAVQYHEAKPFEPFQITGGYTVTPLAAHHDDSQTSLIYHIQRNGRSLLYAHDTGLLPENTWAWLRGRKLHFISLDCTHMLGLSGGGHMGLRENIQVRDRMLAEGIADGESTFMLNHFSHNGRLSHADMEKEAAKHGFLVSWDGLEVSC